MEARKVRMDRDFEVEKIERLLKNIIYYKFNGHLSVYPKGKGGNEWIVKNVGDSGFYGFAVKVVGAREVHFYGGINIWSLWAEHLACEEFAALVGGKIFDTHKKEWVLCDPDSTKNMLTWLKKLKKDENKGKVVEYYLYHLNNLPPELRRLEGSLNAMM